MNLSYPKYLILFEKSCDYLSDQNEIWWTRNISVESNFHAIQRYKIQWSAINETWDIKWHKN